MPPLPPLRFIWDSHSRSAWQQLLAGTACASYRQDWPYGEVVVAEGHGVHRCVARGADGPLALAQFVERRFAAGLRVVLLTHGPVTLGGRPDDGLERALFAEARRRFAAGLLLWTPAAEEPCDRRAGFRRVMSGQSTIHLDLLRPLAQIEAGLDGKWRNKLRQARRPRLDIRLVRGGPLLAWLIAANEAHRRQVGYHGPPPAFFHALAETSRPSRSQFALIACEGSTPVAGAVFQLHGRAATYLLGHTGPEGRRSRAQHLVLWRGIEILRQQGIALLDLGGVDTVGAPGVARFKLGLGGRVVTYAGSYLVPLPWRRRRSVEDGHGASSEKERAA